MANKRNDYAFEVKSGKNCTRLEISGQLFGVILLDYDVFIGKTRNRPWDVEMKPHPVNIAGKLDTDKSSDARFIPEVNAYDSLGCVVFILIIYFSPLRVKLNLCAEPIRYSDIRV